MKRILKTSTAAGLALALLSAPLSLAQNPPNHSDDLHGGTPSHPMEVQHAPAHGGAPAPRMAMPAPHPMEQTHIVNKDVHVTHVTNENIHENVHENVHVTEVTHGSQWQAGHVYAYHGHPMPQVGFSGHYWHHGDRYDGPRYVVSNWQYYDLQPPPAGYEWEQDGDQFVLVAVASGIIADIILGALNP